MTFKLNRDDDDDEGGGGMPKISGFVNQKIASAHHFYISGTIKDPTEYMALFEFIRNAGEDDMVVLHINSCGGDLHTAIQFLRAIAESKATVVSSVEGACMSAATVIFLCSNSQEISNHSMFMFHNYSGIAMGKGNEMHEQLAFERTWSKAFFNDVYKDFMTGQEMEDLMNGKDFWMTGLEVASRLVNRQKNRISAAELAEKIAKAATIKATKELKKTPAKKEPAKKVPLKKTK